MPEDVVVAGDEAGRGGCRGGADIGSVVEQATETATTPLPGGRQVTRRRRRQRPAVGPVEGRPRVVGDVDDRSVDRDEVGGRATECCVAGCGDHPDDEVLRNPAPEDSGTFRRPAHRWGPLRRTTPK